MCIKTLINKYLALECIFKSIINVQSVITTFDDNKLLFGNRSYMNDHTK